MGYSVNPNFHIKTNQKTNNNSYYVTPKAYLTGKSLFSVLVGNYSRQQRTIAVLCLTIFVYICVILYYLYLLSHARDYFGLGSDSENPEFSKNKDKNPKETQSKLFSTNKEYDEGNSLSTPPFITTANNIWIHGFHALLCMQLNVFVIIFSGMMIYYIWAINQLADDGKTSSSSDCIKARRKSRVSRGVMFCPVDLTENDCKKWKSVAEKLVNYRRRWMTAIFGKISIDFTFVCLSVFQFGISKLRVLIAIAVVIFVSAYDFWVIFTVSSFIGRVVLIAREINNS